MPRGDAILRMVSDFCNQFKVRLAANRLIVVARRDLRRPVRRLGQCVDLGVRELSECRRDGIQTRLHRRHFVRSVQRSYLHALTNRPVDARG